MAESFIPTRASLLDRIKNWEDQASWREFALTYGRLIRSAAFKSGLTEAEAEDVVQETFLAVAQNIKNFQYDPDRCSFKSWLLLVTRQRIIWQWRKRPPSSLREGSPSRDANRTATIDRVPDPAGVNLDAVWEEEWQKNLLDAALERAKRQVNPRQFQMFDLYGLQRWPAGDVARTLRVSVAQVYLAKHRVSALLKQEIQKLESARPFT
jgi:RNA polymerase sigma factor (sigma-70 family)